MTTRDEARRTLQEAYGGNITTEEEIEVADLAALHDAATSFLATIDTHADDELPEDLDTQTKRRLSTAETELPKAISGIEAAAEDRLTELEEEEE